NALQGRNPAATRPWQHVLDVLAGYLCYAEALVSDRMGELPSALNFGPDTESAQSVSWLLDHVIKTLRAEGQKVKDWQHTPEVGPAEAQNLALDASLAAELLGWKPILSPANAAAWTARWHASLFGNTSARYLVESQINAYHDLAAI
ncbi:MAG: CDP-glucose 4,6-dehydratase, partial [Alphaproteobacteria bacterium]|nr:CDP-glucose 4,6-dehydratase [Alphaproteobacteria bacterium]